MNSASEHMQPTHLNLAYVLEHAARFHGKVEIVTRLVENDQIHRYTYRDALARAKQLANALKNKLGVRQGDRIATLGWNTYRHLEAWYGIAGQGAICHTVNPRLFEEQIEFILNHAEDSVILTDAPFLPLVERLLEKAPALKHVIVMTDEKHMPDSSRDDVHCYEQFIADESSEFTWPQLHEDTDSSLCYTSGTTGNPKGVMYTHRSNYLHATACNGKDALGVASSDTVLMVVPMFHANSWGLTYSCPMAGAKLVLPGAKLDGAHIYDLLETEKVTFSAAVPTVWNMLLGHLKETKGQLPYLDEVVIGGSAVPRSMIETFDKDYSVTVVHGWGMTELSPIGSSCRLKSYMRDFEYDRQVDMRVKQGPPVCGVEMKVVDMDGCEQPHDGESFGRLLVRGPWIVHRYYKESELAVDENGWFDTGDIATIDEHGYMQITDRAKDLIKSGGEWISSVDLENAAMGHPAVELAAVIGVHHPKWEERPLLIVKSTDNVPSAKELKEYLASRVAKWWLPDDVVYVDDIPLTAAGKISKLQLRGRFKDFQLPT